MNPMTTTWENSGKNNAKPSPLLKRPNFLIITVDEQRIPPPYENDAMREWRNQYLKGQNFLLNAGMEFCNHYVASTACAPSRASLYTGQYPSLHGVTQTDGGGATGFSSNVFWLDPNTVPTLGDYLRTVGYQTYWQGKWHISHPDIVIPGTHAQYLSYNEKTGVPIPEKELLYLHANRLNDYGFDGWIGPEPHGSNPHNSGSSAAIGVPGRDERYAEKVVELLAELQYKADTAKGQYQPWAIVASFVNPHDIALFGAFTRLLPDFKFEIDSSVPPIPPAPTARENLETKPQAQRGYRRIYPQIFQPLADTETYRRLYYSLQLQVDRQVYKVLDVLRKSVFYEDTIIIYTSDHGDLLGAHGLFQKWYQAYEEAIHVPFVVHNPLLMPRRKSVELLTSHVDVLPTILSLAGIEIKEALAILKGSHTEAHPPVGRNLAPLILEANFSQAHEPVYFMTDDDPSKNLGASMASGKAIKPIPQPTHIETVVAKLPTGKDNEPEIWKYSRYFDNPQFWSTPGCEDKITEQSSTLPVAGENDCSVWVTSVESKPSPDQFEMYNLTRDPLETQNLVDINFATPESALVKKILANLLAKQCQEKRLYPSSGEVPGKPACSTCAPNFSVFNPGEES